MTPAGTPRQDSDRSGPSGLERLGNGVMLGLRLVAGTSQEDPDAAQRRRAFTDTKGPVVIARPSPARLVGALLCFGTVVGAVAAGLVFLAAGGHS